jgi:succinyl-diaminopimelate desuccinylase
MTDAQAEDDVGSELRLLSRLIRCKSVTPHDAGCQKILASLLEELGFNCEWMPFGDVTNLWARRGTEGPLLCFAGHTDVVPTGPLEDWLSDPFEPVIRDGLLFGRGAADMKASLASMIRALTLFIEANPDHPGSIALLITSDEEGPADDGTVRVVEQLQQRGEHIDWCIVGEPSSHKTLGDTVRIGRRGSLSGLLKIFGKQGHVAYPHLAENPIRSFVPVFAELNEITWDGGNEHFPPTSFETVEVNCGVGAANVIPGELSAQFNFRYSTEWDHQLLKNKVHSIFDGHEIDYELQWHNSGEPFLTVPGTLTEAVDRAIFECTGSHPEFSTGGGTSDGRFIAPAGADVVELGPLNASIHQVNEHVTISDLPLLTKMYEKILQNLLLQQES